MNIGSGIDDNGLATDLSALPQVVTIELVFAKGKPMVAHIQGMQGPGCDKIADVLARAGTEVGRTHTAEYDEQPVTVTTKTQIRAS